ncbi:uncharacterized protein BXZ73DRAFT_90753 [Epithele typhae]|uniref:uncharacterized protein n=1 Tax=Epithele typhae TaxID=378194 RepID=UPI0020088C6F|nr:uncharacterized protein BXZ73DRAFT_90753 [Epithele typhae]KAH9927499.1 hypothetical protein BXZ73DRAFT_90753 [Epithele typhae]
MAIELAPASRPTVEEREFVKKQTGIDDDERLREHVLNVQSEAFAVHPYPCIRRFAFLRMKFNSKVAGYNQLLKLGRARPDAILLDIGCCFGNDVRKAVADGFRVENVVATDIHPEFWDFGHKLFSTTPKTFPARFIAGDAFDPAHLECVPPFTTDSARTPRPDLPTLTSLNPLRGHVAAIHISAVFHLFGEEEQPGSMIFGLQSGRAEKGFRVEAGVANSHGRQMFCHCRRAGGSSGRACSPGRGPGRRARVGAGEERLATVSDGAKFWVLEWCVTRV